MTRRKINIGKCSIEECQKDAKQTKLCYMHYSRLKRYGTLEKTKHGVNTTCKTDGCDSEHYGLGYCKKHYTSFVQGRYSKNRVKFHGKSVSLKYNPRNGICSKCGRHGHTHMHHKDYDASNVLKHTEELCPSCHATESHRLRQVLKSLEVKQNL